MPKLFPISTRPNFVAIDFETADHLPDSACAIGLVRVQAGEIVSQTQYLICPPRQEFVFTYIHGIRWQDVKNERSFKTLWPTIEKELKDVDFLAAHNSSFDEGVLKACCNAASVPIPKLPFLCTVALARKVWQIYPTKLPDVCRRLNLELDHHQALSDAHACANIVLKASSMKMTLT